MKKNLTGLFLVMAVFGISITGTAYAAPVQWTISDGGNGHWYDLVDGGIDWSNASVEAGNSVYLGVKGHLATITDADENLFLTGAFTPDALHYHWIGGFQKDGSDEPSGGWGWVNGEAFGFSNWEPGEPNNSYGTENAVVFDHGVIPGYGKAWNDLTGSTITDGYIVEYDTVPTPVPAALWLLGSGLACLAGIRKRKAGNSK